MENDIAELKRKVALMERYFTFDGDRLRINMPVQVRGTVNINGITIFTGQGSPEGAVTANVGSIYMRLDGGTSTTLYLKENGTAATGWAATT